MSSDPWNFFLQYLFNQDIVVVCSAGNSGSTDSEDNINIESPRLYAVAGRPGQDKLIVVGASTINRVPWAKANLFHSIIATWAPGNDVYCASSTNPDNYVLNDGSSLSTALTAGMVATYISSRTDLPPPGQHGTFAAFMRQLVWQNSVYAWLGDSPTVPTLTTYNYIPCNEDNGNLPPPISTANFTDTGDNFTSLVNIIVVRTAAGTLPNRPIVSF
jgi:hypothetical protein